MNNTKNENTTNLNGCWYLPVINKEHSEVKGDDNSIVFRYKNETIEGYHVGCIDIMNEEGEVDEYLADLISEMWCVASFSKIYIDKEGFLDNETIEKFKDVNAIHEDIIFLKKAYFREIKKLCEYERYINDNFDFEDINGYWMIFRKEKRRTDYLIDNLRDNLRDNLKDNLKDKLKDNLQYYHSRWWIDTRLKIPFFRSKKDLIPEETKRLAIEYIKKLRIFWTNLYDYVLFSDYGSPIKDKNLSDANLINRMKVLDKKMGRIQFKCCLCLAQLKKDMDIPRIRVFKKLISCDSEIRREYTGDKAKRCYSQMWIDKHAEQYFALSGAPDNDNVGKYYRIAENILNSSYNHCIFKQAPFTEKMRYYYGDKQDNYVEYQGIKEGLETKELKQGFSCCERKLLAKVEELSGKNELDNKNVHIYVKYSPCIICERALNAYEKNGFNFEIIESEKYAGKKFKYLDLDIKIKKI